MTLLLALTCTAQAAKPKPRTRAPGKASGQAKSPPKASGEGQAVPGFSDLNKYPGLLPEFGQLFEKLQKTVQFPPPRAHSRLLPLLPAATVVYGAFPNYGDVTHQALEVFRQELKESAVLRDWWQRGVGPSGPKVEDALDKFYQVSQYLGDEIVVSASMEGREPSLVMVAEVRKPGLRDFLLPVIQELAGKSKPPVRVLAPEELGATGEQLPKSELVILVRPDFVIAASEMAMLRKFSAQLDAGRREFASGAFGQRIAQAYDGGVTTVGAADLQKILSQVPTGTAQDRAMLQRTGFGEVKYFVWEHKGVGGAAVSQAELSFTGPRHGIAGWLGAPTEMGSLSFVSPSPMLTVSVVLANPAKILDDIKELATASNPNAFASIEQSEQALNVNLKRDLLSYLGGEITAEMASVGPAGPVWRAMLRVSDANRLQQTLSLLLAATHMSAQQFEQAGATYYSVRVPAGKASLEIGYTFADGYLVIGSNVEAVADAVQRHKSGESLGKSGRFLASLPPGHPGGCSAMYYQDPMTMAALGLMRSAPEMAQSVLQAVGESKPAVVCAYGEETAIRQASTSPGFDMGTMLVVAAIAVPNLLRARIAANEASAVGSIRTVNTAQVVYASTYPSRGFARNLSMLGPDASSLRTASPQHAGLLDSSLACAGGAWCTKSGFRFNITAVCVERQCGDYVALATPVNTNTGLRSFCSTSDAVIRFTTGAPLTAPITPAQCRKWAPLQ